MENGLWLDTGKKRDLAADEEDILAYLCEKKDLRNIFNHQNQMLFTTNRLLLFENQPFSFIRRLNLTIPYVKKILERKQVNLCYFTLTRKNIELLRREPDDTRCKILYYFIRADAVESEGKLKVLFESNYDGTGFLMEASEMAECLKYTPINVLVILGQHSWELCKYLNSALEKTEIIISISSKGLNSNYFTKEEILRDPFVFYDAEVQVLFFDLTVCYLLKALAYTQAEDCFEEPSLYKSWEFRKQLSLDSPNNNLEAQIEAHLKNSLDKAAEIIKIRSLDQQFGAKLTQ